MFSGTVICFAFVIWGCVTQGYQTIVLQGHNVDTSVDIVPQLDDRALFARKKDPLIGTKVHETVNAFKDHSTVSEVTTKQNKEKENCKTSNRIKRKSDKDVCQLPEDRGTCYALIPRYYYDSASEKCRKFFFGGCGGNGNNFPSKSSCEDKCLKRGTNKKQAKCFCDD